VRVFDTHLHIVDPRFPLVPNQGYLPDPFTVADYRARFAAAGGAVNRAALLFGTDLPGTRAPRPFEPRDLELVREHAGERALWDNAAAVYLRDGPRDTAG